MPLRPAARVTGLDVLRWSVAELMLTEPLLATAATTPGGGQGDTTAYPPDADDEGHRLAALVDLAREGDAEAFGQLYDHYSPAVYRFVFYRVSSQALAEDLTSDTFFRALRSMTQFQWQGKDFGAWLMTIARNLVVDHYKAGRTRLETTVDDFSSHDESTTESPEDEVIAGLTNEILVEALQQLPEEQQTCLVMRFLNENSIAETAKVLGRTEGAIKQLQLRAVRNLAKLMPEGVR
jgi:RNA polymerase sigma-70 factor (ECF subfamily)